MLAASNEKAKQQKTENLPCVRLRGLINGNYYLLVQERNKSHKIAIL